MEMGKEIGVWLVNSLKGVFRTLLFVAQAVWALVVRKRFLVLKWNCMFTLLLFSSDYLELETSNIRILQEFAKDVNYFAFF